MFKNEFQGGPYFEIFSAQGKDPVAHWKLSGGSGIKKEFDKNVKSFVYILEGSVHATKMQLPKDTRHSLSLLQRYLILQVYVVKGADFSVDIGIQDVSGSKRRLFLSAAHKETHTTHLHTKIPLAIIQRDVWLNLCLDMQSLVGDTFKSIENITVSANCRLRRIFTMRSQPPDSTNDEDMYGFSGTNDVELDSIPRTCQLAPDVKQVVQVISMTKLLYYEGKGADIRASTDIDLNSSGGKKNLTNDPYHIAFGTKVAGMSQRKSTTKDSVSSSRSSKSSKNRPDSGELPSGRSSKSSSGKSDRRENIKAQSARDRKNSDPGSNQADPELSVDKESLRTSHTWTDGADGKEEIPFVKPHPPREPSSDRARRKPRVKSAGKERTPHHGAHKEEASRPSHSAGVGVILSHQRHESDSHDRLPPQAPRLVANDDEVAEIMRAMQGEKSPRDSDTEFSQRDTPEARDDSISEVIQVLKGSSLADSNHATYEDSDQEESNDEDKIYTFSSLPKSAPRHRLNSSESKSARHQSYNKPRARRKQDEAEPYQKQNKENVLTVGKGRRKKSESSDFVQNLSSEEEESIRTRVLKHSPSPKPSPTFKLDSGMHHRPIPSPPPIYSEEYKPMSYQTQNGHLNIPRPIMDVQPSPSNSQTRRSISRKSLREISKDDVRLSNNQKPYNSSKYQMADLTDSFEQQMLLSMQRQTMEGEGVEEEETKQNMDRFHYGDDSCTDSSDDDLSTATSKRRNMKSHNYQDEMKMASARLNQDFLSQSNPRDWGKVFSPPIVLPSEIQKSQVSTQLSPGSATALHTASGSGKARTGGESGMAGDTDEEDELDLLFDPVLNCYFDPKTCKYYELVMG